MRQYITLILFFFCTLHVFSAEFLIKSGEEKGFSYNITHDVFIFLEDMSGVTIDFITETNSDFKWFEYTEEYISNPDAIRELTLGADYEIASNGMSTTLLFPKTNHGYYVEYDNGTSSIKKFMWITEFKPIESIKWKENEIFCYDLLLNIQPAMYYVENRQKKLIKRNLDLRYSTFKEENHTPGIYEVNMSEILADTLLRLDSVPYVDTDFTLTDNFAKKLGLNQIAEVTSDSFYTHAVIAYPAMTVNNKQENELDPDNGWETDDSGNIIFYFQPDLAEESAEFFRSSAPLAIDLKSNSSPAVNRYEWHFSRDKNFLNSYIYFEKDINNFILNEPGFHYIKLIVSSYDGTEEICSSISYACINISDSEIYVPNVFTPNGDGQNDEFKVSYKSIASYQCKIYNEWGRKVYDSTDITQGWDGKIGGTNASVGVYYYVIEARGTDGREINKRGTVNLLRSK
jgi:gliding motility-associated-like protein